MAQRPDRLGSMSVTARFIALFPLLIEWRLKIYEEDTFIFGINIVTQVDHKPKRLSAPIAVAANSDTASSHRSSPACGNVCAQSGWSVRLGGWAPGVGARTGARGTARSFSVCQRTRDYGEAEPFSPSPCDAMQTDGPRLCPPQWCQLGSWWSNLLLRTRDHAGRLPGQAKRGKSTNVLYRE